MLMNPDNRGVDHLDTRIMCIRQCVYDAAPNTGPTPANEAIIASGVPKLVGRSRHGAPDRKTQKMPLRTRRSFTRGTPRGLLGNIGLIVAHSSSLSS